MIPSRQVSATEHCGCCETPAVKKCVFVVVQPAKDQGLWICADCARLVSSAWAKAFRAFPDLLESERAQP